MSSNMSIQSKKRKRSSDYSSKSEPAIKKVRSNKTNKLEKDHLIETCGNKRKSSEDAGKKNTMMNVLEKKQTYFKSASEINNNKSTKKLIPMKSTKKKVVSSIPSGFTDLSTKIINSENFKKLRDLRVLLDRTVVDNYFRNKLPSKNHRQKAVVLFSNFNMVSSQNPTILPSISIKREEINIEQLNEIDEMKVVTVNISIKDLMILCNIKGNLKRLHPTDSFKVENKTSSSANNIFNRNAIKNFNYYDSEDRIKTDVLDENLSRIKIEDVSPNLTMTTDENSTKMEESLSDESLNNREMNFSWNENYQSSFNILEMKRMSAIKITDALSALNNYRLLSFYDECPDVSMEEETVRNEIVQKVPDAFDANFVNSGSSLNSSRHSWPFSDESGIFLSDDSTNYNDLSNKFIVNSSFNGPVVGNEAASIK